MRINKYFFLICFIISLAVQAQTKLNSAQVERFKAKIAEKAAQTQSIVGDFVQTKHLSFLENEIESSGKFYYAAPNRVKWVYQKPFAYSIIFTKGKLLINDDGDKKEINTSTNKLFEKLSDLIANSINGKMLEDEDFKVEYLENENFYIANLIPMNNKIKEVFSTIELYFNKETTMVEKVKLTETSGDFTLIEFSALQLNNRIDDSVFQN